jgi:hypothetical protein
LAHSFCSGAQIANSGDAMFEDSLRKFADYERLDRGKTVEGSARNLGTIRKLWPLIQSDEGDQVCDLVNRTYSNFIFPSSGKIWRMNLSNSGLNI